MYLLRLQISTNEIKRVLLNIVINEIVGRFSLGEGFDIVHSDDVGH